MKKRTRTKSPRPSEPDAPRLEALWSGEFGDEYVARNAEAGAHRGRFWLPLLAEATPRRALEVGCNVGANLKWIADVVPPTNVWGVDVNARALTELRRRIPDVNAVLCPARELPFRDGWFDFVFTMGVLIHQSPVTLPLVMSEIVRCSSRWVLCGEYYAEEPVEVPYRGQTGALFKRDFGSYYRELFPDLTLAKKGFLGRKAGWDDVTWWLFEKSRVRKPDRR